MDRKIVLNARAKLGLASKCPKGSTALSSEQEARLRRMVAQGCTSAQMAEALGLSLNPVSANRKKLDLQGAAGRPSKASGQPLPEEFVQRALDKPMVAICARCRHRECGVARDVIPRMRNHLDR